VGAAEGLGFFSIEKSSGKIKRLKARLPSLLNRGISLDTIKQFRNRFTPPAAIPFLDYFRKKNNFTIDILEESFG